MLDSASVARHGVAPKELGPPSCDGLGAPDVQEMPDAVDRALVDVPSRAVMPSVCATGMSIVAPPSVPRQLNTRDESGNGVW